MHYLYCTSSLSNFCNKHNNTKEINQVGEANNLELILTGLTITLLLYFVKIKFIHFDVQFNKHRKYLLDFYIFHYYELT